MPSFDLNLTLNTWFGAGAFFSLLKIRDFSHSLSQAPCGKHLPVLIPNFMLNYS